MVLFTIYDHPRDFPDGFVIRRYIADNLGVHRCDWHRTAKTLEEVRQFVPPGSALIPRDINDDPVIVETWI